MDYIYFVNFLSEGLSCEDTCLLEHNAYTLKIKIRKSFSGYKRFKKIRKIELQSQNKSITFSFPQIVRPTRRLNIILLLVVQSCFLL